MLTTFISIGDCLQCMQSKMIRISLKNWEKLRVLGHTPDSFNDIISKILEDNGYVGAAVVDDGE